jgi:hypothetical protein
VALLPHSVAVSYVRLVSEPPSNFTSASRALPIYLPCETPASSYLSLFSDSVISFLGSTTLSARELKFPSDDTVQVKL